MKNIPLHELRTAHKVLQTIRSDYPPYSSGRKPLTEAIWEIEERIRERQQGKDAESLTA